MDERTLNDLLECSVCLDRLDTSSKVLPCQHTFCRKCLEVIVASRQELRCPECRILVDVKIDELPPNVLLMRILEGMKNASQNQNITKSPRNTCNNTSSTNHDNSLTESSKSSTNEQTPIRAITDQNSLNRRIVPHAYALYDFISKETSDLNFKKGDVILLKRKLDANWLIGELNGREGSFPLNYVQIIVPLPAPQCLALYDFKMGPNEEEGCLTFKKGTIINVLRRVDHNWAEGRIGSCIGIFPMAFVEMNSLAKHLLETGGSTITVSINFPVPRCLPPVPFDTNASDSTSTDTTSPNSTCSSNTSSNSIPSSPTSNANSPQNQANVKYRDLKEKRHSLNALIGNTNLSIVQSNRHSAEILSIPDSVEANCSENNQTSATSKTGGPANSHEALKQSRPQQQTTRANIFKTTGQQIPPNLPWAYLALYPYKPRKSDELELKKGCVYFVTERCLDGWYKGNNWADKSGVFPGNYVTPLRNRDQQQLIHQRKIAQNSSQPQQLITAQNSHAQSHDYGNTSTHPPPELPPRINNTIPSGSVWTKPLGQHVESFFNRKPSNPQPRNNKTSSGANAASKSLNTLAKDVTVQNSQVSKEKDKKESNSSSAVSLMKRLTNIKRSKSPTHSNQTNYSMDNPVFEDTVPPTTASSSSHKHSISMSHPVHVRSGSCPSQLLQSLPVDLGVSGTPSSSADQSTTYGSQRLKGHKERPTIQSMRQQIDSTNRARNLIESNGTNPSTLVTSCSGPAIFLAKQPQSQASSNNIIHHRKSQSLDANTISSQISGNSPGGKQHPTLCRENRFRCIVSYPPNSEMELELNVGDIVFVHRKQKNGWYKGTHARTNKTGLFPASFVAPDI